MLKYLLKRYHKKKSWDLEGEPHKALDDKGSEKAQLNKGHASNKKPQDVILSNLLNHLQSTFIDTVTQNIYFKDLSSKFIYCNPSFVKYMGFNDLSELIGKTDFNIFTDEHASQAYADEQAIIKTYTPFLNIVEKETWPGGLNKWVSTSKFPLYGEDGSIIGTFGISTDVTEIAQEELIKLKRGVEFSPATVVITNSEGDIEYVNRKFEDLTGYKKEEVLGKNPRILNSGQMDPKVYVELWSTILDGNEWKGELLNRKKNGELYWEIASISAIKNNRDVITHFIAIKEDISDRKKREKEKQRDEQRLQAIISMMQKGEYDEKQLLENALEEAINLTDSIIGFIYHYDEDTKEFTLNSWSNNVMKECEIAEPRTIYHLNNTGIWGEVVRQRKHIIVNDFQKDNPLKKGYPEGHAPLHKFMSIPIFEEERIVAVVGVANKTEDYSSIDLLQLTLLMSSVWVLVGRIRLNNRLKETNLSLQDTNAQKDKFFSIISHDLRGPFSALINFTELIHQNYDELTDNERKEYLGMISDSSTKAFNLLENLLEWSQSQQGLKRYNPVKVNLADLTSDIVGLLDNQFKSKGITMDIMVPNPTHVLADDKMIRTVIRNLLGNAIKFTDKGGKVEILAEKDNGKVLITVSDNGIGMGKHQADTLFEMKVAEGKTGTSGEKGSGLGLILCKEFIEAHSERIWVESEVGKGSRFFFTLQEG